MARPTKFNKEIADKFIGFISDGLTIRLACTGCGISEDSIARWRRKNPAFDEAVVEASNREWQTSESLVKYGQRQYKRNERATKPFPGIVPLLQNYRLKPKEPQTYLGFPIRDDYVRSSEETEPYYNEKTNQIEWVDKNGIFHSCSVDILEKDNNTEVISGGFII